MIFVQCNNITYHKTILKNILISKCVQYFFICRYVVSNFQRPYKLAGKLIKAFNGFTFTFLKYYMNLNYLTV